MMSVISDNVINEGTGYKRLYNFAKHSPDNLLLELTALRKGKKKKKKKNFPQLRFKKRQFIFKLA